MISLRKICYLAAALALYKFILPLITYSPVDCLVENHSRRTISQINFYYVSDDTSNTVNIPPNAEAVVKVPHSRGDGRYISSDSRYAKYVVRVEFSDGFIQKWYDKNLRHCGKIIISDQGDTVEATFHNIYVTDKIGKFLNDLTNLLK